MSDARLLFRFVLGLGAALLVTIALVAYMWFKVSADEYSTCQIQARGLPAGRALAASMGAIHTLVAPPQNAAGRRRLARLPQSTQDAVHTLDKNSDLYFTLERGQPKSRTC